MLLLKGDIMKIYLTFLEQLTIKMASFPPLQWIIISNVVVFMILMINKIAKWKY